MLKNIGSNWFLMTVTGLATFFLMPFNLHHLGSAQYGVWLLISAQVAYLALLHLGVPMASVREMTQAIASKDTEKLNRVIASCSWLYIGFGLLVGLLGIPLMLDFERSYMIPVEMRGAARVAFMLSLLQIGIGFIANMPFAILSAYQAFVPKNIVSAIAILLRILVNVGLISWYPDITMLAVAVVALTAIEMVLGWGYVLYRYPAVRPRLHHFQLATISSIMRFSFYVFLLALGGQLAFQTTALVIGRWMTTADVVTFAIPNSLMLILLQFVGGISSVIMPLATNLHTRGETRALRDILFKWTKISMALAWCAGFFLLVFGPAFLEFWVNKGYTAESGSVLRILMVSYLVLVPVRGVAVPMLMGIGEAKWLTIATLAAGVLNLVLSVLWVGPFGLLGAAWATFVPNVLLAAAMTWLACRTLHVRMLDYLTATVPLALLGGFAGLAVLEWWERLWHPAGLIGLGIAGLLTIAVSVAIWTGLVLRHDPHVTTPRLSDFIPWRLQ